MMSPLGKLIGLLRTRPAAAGDDSDPLTITGMIDGIGAGGGSTQGSDWFGTFTFAVWRAGNGPVRTEPLRIEQHVGPKDALKRFMDRLEARQLIRIAIAADPEPYGERPRLKAEMRTVVGPAEDAEIAAVAAPILDPPPYHHPKLGEFRPDKRFPKSLEGHATWLGRRIGLVLNADGADAPEQLAETALKLLADQLGWQNKVERAVYDELHPVWIDAGWGTDGDSPTREQWLSRLTLKSITIDEGGSFDFDFDDGELFWGHYVFASGSLDEGVTDAQMAG